MSYSSFRGGHLPVILQTEVAECGLSCLAMVASYLGLRTDLATLRGRFAVSLNGTSMLILTEYADRLRLSSRALSLTLDELRDLKTPAILHWGLNHFVVLRRATAKGVVIHDPAVGVRHLSYDEISQPAQCADAWAGPAILMQSALSYMRRRRPRRQEYPGA